MHTHTRAAAVVHTPIIPELDMFFLFNIIMANWQLPRDKGLKRRRVCDVVELAKSGIFLVRITVAAFRNGCQ